MLTTNLEHTYTHTDQLHLFIHIARFTMASFHIKAAK